MPGQVTTEHTPAERAAHALRRAFRGARLNAVTDGRLVLIGAQQTRFLLHTLDTTHTASAVQAARFIRDHQTHLGDLTLTHGKAWALVRLLNASSTRRQHTR